MGFFSWLFGGGRQIALSAPSGTDWDGKPWKSLFVYSDNIRGEAALTDIAKGVAQAASSFSFPMLIAIKRKLEPMTEDRSGRPLSWEGSMVFLWPEDAADAAFVDSFLRPRFGALRGVNVGKSLIVGDDPDPLFKHYPSFEEAAKTIDVRQYAVVRCNC